jgi:hypothetical protein
MPKNNKHPAGSESENCTATSENVVENEKYVKMLELQRLVLTRLVSPEFNQSSAISDVDCESSDTNNSLLNK